MPAFWTAFAAVYFFGLWAGLAVALVTPVVNLLLTGLPAMERVASMSLELAAFVAIAAWLVKTWPTFVLTAPLAYLPAKAIAIAVRWAVPAFEYHRNVLEHWTSSVVHGMAGLGVLLIVNVVVVRLAQADSDWDSD